MYDLESAACRSRSGRDLTAVVCWTRMQAEAGQGLQAIVRRKELERRSNNGVFCWGVGNPPAKSISKVLNAGTRVDAVFSVMKTKPKTVDSAPERVVMWRSYISSQGYQLPLPQGSLVTSRAESAKGAKASHYALMCYSEEALALGDFGPFDPLAYRNLSAEGGLVGASQVTALVSRHQEERPETPYRINMQASLWGSYWVKLVDPVALSTASRHKLEAVDIVSASTTEWLDLVDSFRDTPTANETAGAQLALW